MHMHASRRVGAFRQWKINRADRVIGDVPAEDWFIDANT